MLEGERERELWLFIFILSFIGKAGYPHIGAFGGIGVLAHVVNKPLFIPQTCSIEELFVSGEFYDKGTGSKIFRLVVCLCSSLEETLNLWRASKSVS